MRKRLRPPNPWQWLSQWLDSALFGAQQSDQTKLRAGHEAERLAASYLKAKGYEIVECNLRIGRGELDIVARQRDTLVIVEVKSGRADGVVLPREHVNPAKRRQLSKLTEAYRKQQRCLGRSVRIDIVEVVFDAQGRPRIEHLEGAVREGG